MLLEHQINGQFDCGVYLITLGSNISPKLLIYIRNLDDSSTATFIGQDISLIFPPLPIPLGYCNTSTPRIRMRSIGNRRPVSEPSRYLHHNFR